MHSSPLKGLASFFAFLFDLDGVIIDSMPLHTQAWSTYLEQLGLPATDAAIASRMHGKRNDDIVEDFIGRGLDPAAIFEHGAAKERLYRKLARRGSLPEALRGRPPGCGFKCRASQRGHGAGWRWPAIALSRDCGWTASGAPQAVPGRLPSRGQSVGREPWEMHRF